MYCGFGFDLSIFARLLMIKKKPPLCSYVIWSWEIFNDRLCIFHIMKGILIFFPQRNGLYRNHQLVWDWWSLFCPYMLQMVLHFSSVSFVQLTFIFTDDHDFLILFKICLCPAAESKLKCFDFQICLFIWVLECVSVWFD